MCISDSIYNCETYLNYYPKNAELIEKLEKKFLSFLEDTSYKKLHVPSIIQGDVLEKCGYFNTFPQHLTAVCSIKKENQDTQLSSQYMNETHLNYHNHYLTPAACVHVYPMLEDYYNGEDICFTFKENVFRYEDGNYQNDERLWEFLVREFVFVGTKEYVIAMLEKFKESALNFSREIDLSARLVSASDVFYPTTENKMREKLQLANDLKFELQMSYKDRRIATSSFNFHDTHFSKPFNFDEDGKIVTGCVGFGLDRWILCCNEKGYKQ